MMRFNYKHQTGSSGVLQVKLQSWCQSSKLEQWIGTSNVKPGAIFLCLLCLQITVWRARNASQVKR